MSSHKIREDKTCLNCNTHVPSIFCPKCGQRNVESRESFHHLFTHFITDFLHYDSSFWRTTKYLLLYPGRLSIEYMDGRRKSYVNPFTLYIFVSFVAFFVLFSSSPVNINSNKPKIHKKVYEQTQLELERQQINPDSLEAVLQTYKIEEQKFVNKKRELTFNIEEFKKIVDEIDWDNPARQEKFINSLFNYLPKFLFFYMPIFAFFLWLFHGKKKRNYFDSGVFTLHFFASFLLILSLYVIIDKLVSMTGWEMWEESISLILFLMVILYTIVYFFVGVHRFYQNRRFIVVLKGGFLFFINSILILIFIALYAALIAYYAYW